MTEQTFQEYCDRVRKLEKRVKALEQEPNIITLTQKEYSDLCIQLKGLGWKFVQEQEPISVNQDTVPVKLRINKVSKHISNIDLDELEQEPFGPCDLCRFNPPSSADGKPCTMCPAEKEEKKNENCRKVNGAHQPQQ